MEIKCILLFLLTYTTTVLCSEVTVKSLDDEIIEIPGPGGVIISREHSKRTGYLRDGELVMVKHQCSTSIHQEGSVTKSESIFYFVIAKGKKIIRIDGDRLFPFYVMSAWPIYVVNVNTGAPKMTSKFSICIPDIQYFESIEFEDGQLKPLMQGEEYLTFKAESIASAAEMISN